MSYQTAPFVYYMNRALKYIPGLVLAILTACKENKELLPSISIDGENHYELSGSSATIKVSIATDCDSWNCEFAGNVGWISCKKRSPEYASFFVSANESYETRTAEIIFFAPDRKENRAQATVTVTQLGREHDPELTLSCDNVQFSADGGSSSIEVRTSYADWGYVNNAAGWLTVTQSDDVMTLTATANKADEERSAEITVYSSVQGRELSRTISVIQAPADIAYAAENLSAEGTSNCYLISHRGEYYFDASVKGNGVATEGLDAPSRLDPASAALVWQSSKGMISSVTLEGNTVHFTATRTKGNALIAAKNAAGEIIWSWHIWFPAKKPESLAMDGGFTIMDMNLGAMDNRAGEASSHGLLYQWGRKDPFPASPVAKEGSINTKNAPVYDIDGNEVKILASEMYSSANNTLSYSISHPATCLSNGATGSKDWLKDAECSPAYWGNPRGSVRDGEGEYKNNGGKSYYDPCPQGWRVPPRAVFKKFTGSGQYAFAGVENGEVLYDENGNMSVYYMFGKDSFNVYDYNGDGKFTIDDFTAGWHFNLSAGVHSYFPAATRYDGQYAMLMGSMVGQWGSYWTNAPTYDSKNASYEASAIALAFNICDYNKNTQITISPSGNGAKADAYSVRCIKE